MVRSGWLATLGVAAGAALEGSSGAQSGPAVVESAQKISHTQGGRVVPLRDGDQLGRAVACLGDLDGNGVVDLAAAGHGADDGGIDQGAVFVYFLTSGGRVDRAHEISELAGGFAGQLDPGDQMGRAIANLGDVDGDGLPDLVVGANYDDDGGMNRGAVWILCLDRSGTVRRTSKISSTQGGFTGPLRNQDEFGRAVCSPGDLDGDGVPELAAGAPTDNTGGTRRGAVWLLFLQRDGRVKRQVKIASGLSGFTGRLRNLDWFGFAVAPLGDFDRDGVQDLLVGAALDDDGAVNAGAAWLLYLWPDGTVKDQRKISMRSGGFTGALESPDQFGTSVAALGDLNGDGVTEIAVGAVKDGDGGAENGAVYVLFMNPDGSVAYHRKISDTQGAFAPPLDNWDWLGSSLAPIGDLDQDGVPDVVIGARNDDDGGSNRGALYVTCLRGSAAFASVERHSPEAVSAPEPAGAELRVTSEALGRFAEPEGSLELVDGAEGGRALRFRALVPEDLRGAAACACLVVARSRAPAAFAERTGRLFDPRTVVGTSRPVAVVGAVASGEIELELDVPADLDLRGAELVVQALWSRAVSAHDRTSVAGDALRLRFE